MGDLGTYHLSDFILFSPATYFRQFELYNQAIWPLHIVAGVFLCILVFTLRRKPRWSGRLIAVIFVTSWLWVAFAFLYQRFYQIHVIANWYAVGFVVEAALIAWYGIIKNRLRYVSGISLRKILGIALLFVVIVLYPFIPILSDRVWLQYEMIFLAPDPTALATLAVLFICRSPKVLFIIPVTWVLLSGVTLFVM